MAGIPRSALARTESDAYLGALFTGAPPGSFVELRWRHAGGMRHAFHRVDALPAVAAALDRLAARTDVYVGVLPRQRRGGGLADLVAQGRVLWVDCDTDAAVEAVRAYSPPPPIVVASGTAGHRHGYWLLREPIDVATIEIANRALAIALGADRSCADAARILRPPSWNYKHRPPEHVRLLRCEPDARYAVADVVDVSAVEPSPPSSGRGERPPDDDPLLELAPKLYVEVLAGLRVPRHRKVRCPFHDDSSPSLHVYDDPARGWYCFGCRRGGSVYDFGAALWGLSTRGAEFSALQHRLDEELSVFA